MQSFPRRKIHNARLHARHENIHEIRGRQSVTEEKNVFVSYLNTKQGSRPSRKTYTHLVYAIENVVSPNERNNIE